jgi:hypothetical protein
MQTDNYGAQKRVMMVISFNFIDRRAGAADGEVLAAWILRFVTKKREVRVVDIAVKVMKQIIPY